MQHAQTTQPEQTTTILVTGANRGIGLALTRQALAHGDQVVAACRRPEGAVDLAQLGVEYPGALVVVALDVTSAESVQSLVAELGDRPIDALINNAGIYGGAAQSLADMDYVAWSEAFAVNTMAPLRVTTAFLPALRRSACPRVLTLTSQMGALSGKSTGDFAYRSSKAAANKVMQVLAEELRPEGIVVVPVHPGWVRTDMGGPGAPVSAEESAAGLLALVHTVTLDHSGRFLTWLGEEHAW